MEKTERLLSTLGKFRGKKILVVGDIMLDNFIRGKVKRISPEAPVPIINVTHETYVPGGGGNVACNLAALGVKVTLLSVVGADDAGNRLRTDLSSRGIETACILTDAERPTIQKIRVIAEHQQALRFDRESTDPLSAALRRQLLAQVKVQIPLSDAVVLSDYGKGIFTPEVLTFCIGASHRHLKPVVIDPKIEHFKKYRHATCLTPNTLEAWQGMRLIPKDGQAHVEELGKKILQRLRLTALLLTQGEEGMTLFESAPRLRITHIPTTAAQVFDVTGAGDTVIAVLTAALACGAGFLDAATIANHAAGVVIGKLGTATVTPEEIITHIQHAK